MHRGRVVGHVVGSWSGCRRRDQQWEGWGRGGRTVPIRALPLCPRVLSSGIGAKFWEADGVEFLYDRVGVVGLHECVWLCHESEGDVVDLDWGQYDGVGLSGRALGGGGLYGVNRLEESLCRWGEVGCHCSCVMGLSVFVCSEECV
jgi:hypothetical protein